jgi:hypothetical protein
LQSFKDSRGKGRGFQEEYRGKYLQRKLMTAIQDDWGHDPSVQSMRRIFARMEATQKNLLGCLNISPLDTRLRHWREEAQLLFEQTWPLASRKGITRSEDDAALLYLHCLARILRLGGVEVTNEALPFNEKILGFLNGRLK